MIRYRASQAPLAMLCPGSVHPGENEVLCDPFNPAAAMGTAVHEFAADLVMKRERELTYYASKHGVGRRESQVLCACVAKLWRSLAPMLPNPTVEVPLRRVLSELNCELSGHIDVESLMSATWGLLEEAAEPVCCAAVDWKSTRKFETANYHAQMMLYLALEMLEHPSLEEFQYIIGFIREVSQMVSDRMSRKDVKEFLEEFLERVVGWDGRTYSPNLDCRWCRRAVTCPAYREMFGSGLVRTGEIVKAGERGQIVLAPEEVLPAYEQIGAVAGMCEMARGYLKALVMQAGKWNEKKKRWEIAAKDGRALAVAQEKRETLIPEVALPMLQERVGEEVVYQAMSLSKTPIRAAVREQADRGEKKTAEEALWEELREAGAMEAQEISVCRVVKATKLLEEKAG